MTGSRYLLATRSEGKLRELREIFADFGLQVVDLSAIGIPKTENEDNLEAFKPSRNALAKALLPQASGGMPAFGDDSGMCVDAFGGDRACTASAGQVETISQVALGAANNGCW